MTVEEVAHKVNAIANVGLLEKDDEKAHCMEEGLWREVLKAIRDGVEDPKALAAAALETCDLNFGRW